MNFREFYQKCRITKLYLQLKKVFGEFIKVLNIEKSNLISSKYLKLKIFFPKGKHFTGTISFTLGRIWVGIDSQTCELSASIEFRQRKDLLHIEMRKNQKLAWKFNFFRRFIDFGWEKNESNHTYSRSSLGWRKK